jgi:hypothetical protein
MFGVDVCETPMTVPGDESIGPDPPSVGQHEKLDRRHGITPAGSLWTGTFR